MEREILIDEDVYEALKGQAEPFEDTPNTVLRRLLRLPEDAELDIRKSGTEAPGQNGASGKPASAGRRGRKRGQKTGTRAKKGSLLPETEYEIPILKALADVGGRAPSSEVVTAVGQVLADRFTDIDRESLPTGGIRWENRVHFTRLRLKDDGFLSQNSPRGTWELSDQGRARLESVPSR